MKTTKWIIDATHSEFAFKVRKLMVTTVKGNLEVFEGTVETETDQFDTVNNINFAADASSIKTDDGQRDEHLKSNDFFDTETFPYIRFFAKNYSAKEKKIEGDLTIRNITKSVVFDVEFKEKEVINNGKIGLSIFGKVNRHDFGLSWNGKNKAGDVIVGDGVKLCANVQFMKQN